MRVNVWLGTWIAIMVVTGVVELSTAALVSIWMTAGAAVAAVLALFDVSPWIQVVAFVIVSGALLALFFKKIRSRKAHRTNADGNVGREGLVTETIDNLRETGRVQLGGLDWAAKSADSKEIPSGTVVVVREIQGVHVIVSEKE